MARPPRKTALYSPASPVGDAKPQDRAAAKQSALHGEPEVPVSTAVQAVGSKTKLKPPASLTRRWLLLFALMLAASLYVLTPWRTWMPQRLTQEDIDQAVLKTLSEKPLPAPGAKAYANVIGSVVRVIGMNDPKDKPVRDAKDVLPPKKPDGKPGAKEGPAKESPSSESPAKSGPTPDEDDDKNTVGTGVVIIDNGTILTNLHVVLGARRVKVEFADGLVADADVIGTQPEHDLAVLRARKIPDDLKAATMRSTEDLRPGDRVTAVGFPFGIGPSVSHGVVSGLKRNFRSPDGGSVLTNLIQFDAAANPGNSGGPLVTDDGEVVGIVTAIYNPTAQRFFVGLGFAVPIENAARAAGMPPF